jgi:hypothetical protein
MRTLSRLFLLVSLVASLWFQVYEPATRATAQLGYGCYAFQTDEAPCASGCSDVDEARSAFAGRLPLYVVTFMAGHKS